MYKFLQKTPKHREIECNLLRKTGFVELLAELPILKDICIVCFENIDIDLIKQLIASHEHLSKLEYRLHDPNNHHKLDLALYQKKFEDWLVTHHADGKWSSLTFDRKN